MTIMARPIQIWRQNQNTKRSCVVISVWQDGFGPSSVKNNRNAVCVKSCTFGTPKDSVNGTDNTFATLLGLKNATGWRKAEHQCQAEIERMTQAKEPMCFFHGVLRKMVPCMFLLPVSIADKAERPQLTGTIGPTSNTHRCFGVSGLLEMPRCSQKIEKYLVNSHLKRKLKFGWSAKICGCLCEIHQQRCHFSCMQQMPTGRVEEAWVAV